MSLGVPAEPLAQATCSRAGCGAAGRWQVRWRNPRIHGPERAKIWLACDEHRDYLQEFVAARGFLLDVVPIDEKAVQ